MRRLASLLGLLLALPALADDTAALCAVLNAGGIVALESRTYDVSAACEVADAAGLTVEGHGAVIRAADGMTTADNSGAVLRFVRATRLLIRDLTIEGNKVNRPPGGTAAAHLLLIRGGSDLRLENVQTVNSPLDGLHVRADDPARPITFPRSVTLQDCAVASNARNGLFVSNADGLQIHGGRYETTGPYVVGFAPGTGAQFEGSFETNAPITNVSVTGAWFGGNDGYGLTLSRVDRATVSGCTFTANARGGLKLRGKGIHASGLLFHGFTSADFGIVELAFGATDVSLGPMRFYDVGAVPRLWVHGTVTYTALGLDGL